MALDVSKGIAHLDHLEDLVLLYGKEGAKLASETIDKFLRKFEKGAEESSDLTISEKIDGAPSLYFGTAPDGRFFVGTKGVLSKTEQKISYSLADIQKFYPESGVKDVLAKAFQALKPAFKEKGFACQGDLLWSDKSQKSESTISGKQYLTFRPNTILYGIPVDPKSDSFKKAYKAILGIVIHGVYETHFIDGDRVEFNRQGADKVREFADSINQHPNVFCIHPYVDNIDAIRGNEDVLKELSETLVSVHQAQGQIDPQFDREWRKGDEPHITMAKTYLPQFVNQQVRSSGEGETILTAKDEKEFMKRFKKQFEEFVGVKGKAEVDKMKSLKGKEQKAETFKMFSEWMKESYKTFEPMFLCFFRLYNIKVLIIQLLDKLEKKLGGTFVVDRKDDFSVKAVKPEGYVFLGGDNMVKIVDRLEFSKNNMLYGRFAEEKQEEKNQLMMEKTITDEVVEDVFAAMESLKKLNDGWVDEQMLEAANRLKDFAAIYVGRFQPLTKGHVKTIAEMAKLFKSVHVVIVEKSKKIPQTVSELEKAKKNPLDNETRKRAFETDPILRQLTNLKFEVTDSAKAYALGSINQNTNKPIIDEVKQLFQIPKEEGVVLVVGPDRYKEVMAQGNYFDVRKGKTIPAGKIGVWGMPEADEKRATEVRDAIMQGDDDAAKGMMGGGDNEKQKIIDMIRDEVNHLASLQQGKMKQKTKLKESIQRLSEQINEDEEGDSIQLDEALDIVIDTLEE